MKERKKSVIFVSVTPFPNGQAATNRIVSLIKNMPDMGWQTKVLCTASVKFATRIKNDIQYFEKKGEYSKVKFHYLSLNVKRERFLVHRLVSRLLGWIKLPFVLSGKRCPQTILLTNLTQFYYVLYLKFISLILRYRFILIRSEYPFFQIKNRLLLSVYQNLIGRWIFKCFDGFILMTYSLEKYFSAIKSRSSTIKIIPMTVDLDRFSEHRESPFDFEYIGYAGSLSSEKDGVDILIKAFSSISKDYPDMRLVIIGDIINNKFYDLLISLINTLSESAKERIVFTGRVDSRMIPDYLMNAKILALSRPDSEQARGGFPTKLGEYLATGNPVVVTSVGEIPIYIKHMETALLCNPGDIKDFAQKLDWVLRNYSQAKKIGLQGRKVAEKVFNANVQAKSLAEFLDLLLYK